MKSTEINMTLEYERNCWFFKAQEWQIQIIISARGKLIALKNVNLPFLSKKSQDWAVNLKFFWSLLFWPRKNAQPWYLISRKQWVHNLRSLVELIDLRKCFPYLYSNWYDLFQNSKKYTEIGVIFLRIKKSAQKFMWSFSKSKKVYSNCYDLFRIHKSAQKSKYMSINSTRLKII